MIKHTLTGEQPPEERLRRRILALNNKIGKCLQEYVENREIGMLKIDDDTWYVKEDVT
jgi:membrane protein implicated in regulation of membrane protease activity